VRDFVKTETNVYLFSLIAGFLSLTCLIFHSGQKKLMTSVSTVCPMLDVSGRDTGLSVPPLTEQSMYVMLFC